MVQWTAKDVTCTSNPNDIHKDTEDQRKRGQRA